MVGEWGFREQAITKVYSEKHRVENLEKFLESSLLKGETS